MIKKIVIAILLSLGITLVVANQFFFREAPKLNTLKIKRMAADLKDEAVILKNTLTYKLSPKKIDYAQVFENTDMTFEFEDDQITPVPVESPTPVPTSIPSPTSLPPTPTETPDVVTPEAEAPSPTRVPTRKPTKAPTRAPTKVPTPEPTESPADDPLFIENPLDQPYYNPRLAYKCYNPERFIEVYGGGGTGGACYANAQAHVNDNLTSVSILGKSITVHKKAYPYFKAVSDRLKNFKGYKINTIGAYVFRCNVNASTVDRFDLCSEGCVLSTHAFGIAVDINWEENCNGCSSFDMPREIIDAFESYGFRWGGRYKSIFGSTIDPMHFELMVDLCRDVV